MCHIVIDKYIYIYFVKQTYIRKRKMGFNIKAHTTTPLKSHNNIIVRFFLKNQANFIHKPQWTSNKTKGLVSSGRSSNHTCSPVQHLAFFAKASVTILQLRLTLQNSENWKAEACNRISSMTLPKGRNSGSPKVMAWITIAESPSKVTINRFKT